MDDPAPGPGERARPPRCWSSSGRRDAGVYPEARHAFDVSELPPLLRRPGGAIGHDPQATAAAHTEVKRFLGR